MLFERVRGGDDGDLVATEQHTDGDQDDHQRSHRLDPLGSARSHGCVRLANGAIDQLVETVGDERLLGTPVEIT